MRSYPFITQLYTNVLSKSNAIQGRFYLCPKMGTEINADDLDQVLKDEVRAIADKKYPLTLMMPPVSYGNHGWNKGEWSDFIFILFFLKTTFYNSANQTQTPNISTRTSTHTVPEDWHDMERAARNFIRVLDRLQRIKGMINNSFRLDQEHEQIIRPVSLIGADRVSGVRLDFRASLFIGCCLEDYNEADIETIQIPVEDPHPEHAL